MTTLVDWFLLEKIIDLCEKAAVRYLLLLMASQNERIVHSTEIKTLKDLPPDLSQFLANDIFLKIMQKFLIFHPKSSFRSISIYIFVLTFLVLKENGLIKKVKVNFKMYETIYCEINNYNTHIAQYLKKESQSDI